MLSKEEEKALVKTIREAEKLTSGEIRVHIQKTCGPDPVKEAIARFDALGLSATREKNGVLIFLASEDKKFAIIGDKGIQEKAGDELWNDLKTSMEEHFKKGDFLMGLQTAVSGAGKALSHYFPHRKNDVNELPDDISYS
jgi:uncharacterized membrane protein